MGCKINIKVLNVTIISLLIGLAIGYIEDNIGLWICLGLAIGVAVDHTRKSKAISNNNSNDGDKEWNRFLKNSISRNLAL